MCVSLRSVPSSLIFWGCSFAQSPVWFLTCMCSPVFCSMWGVLGGLPGCLWVVLCLCRALWTVVAFISLVPQLLLNTQTAPSPPLPVPRPAALRAACGAAVETQPFVSYLSRVTLFRCLVCGVLKTAVSSVSLDVLVVSDERVKSVHCLILPPSRSLGKLKFRYGLYKQKWTNSTWMLWCWSFL